MMSASNRRYGLAGLGLIVLVNAVVLAGVAWNRQPPADSRLQLSERELRSHYSHGPRESSGIGLQLDYRWPSDAEGGSAYPQVSAAQMRELGFQLPAEPDEDAVRRYRRQLSREALLVLELDGPAYRRELQLASARQAEAERLQRLAPDNPSLRKAALDAGAELARQRERASRLLVVDLGLDRQALRARYPDRQRYAIVPAEVRPYVHQDWQRRGEQQGSVLAARSWRLGGVAELATAPSIHLPQRWHGLYASLPRRGDQPGAEPVSYDKLFVAELAFGRRLEPWVLRLEPRQP